MKSVRTVRRLAGLTTPPKKLSGAVEAAEPEIGQGGIVDPEEFARGEDRRQGRVAVDRLEGEAVGLAAEDSGIVAVAELLLDARAIVLLVEIIADEVEPGADGRLDPDRAAQRVEVAVVDPAVVERVLDIAVAVDASSRRAGLRRSLPIGTLTMPVSFIELKLPYSALAEAWMSLRSGRAVMKLTTPDVALRPNRVPCGPRSTSSRSRSKYSVSNRRVEVSGMSLTWIPVARIAREAGAQIADAADGEARRGEVGLGVGDVGKALLEVAGILDLLALERLAGKGGDRDRNALQRFRAALGGDDDVASRRRCRWPRSPRRRSGPRRRRRRW